MTQLFRSSAILRIGLLLCSLIGSKWTSSWIGAAEPAIKSKAMYRGPVDLVLTANEKFAITINEISATVSLVNLESGSVVDEKAVGEKPGGIQLRECGGLGRP